MSRKGNDKPRLPPWDGHLGGEGSQLVNGHRGGQVLVYLGVYCGLHPWGPPSCCAVLTLRSPERSSMSLGSPASAQAQRDEL